MTKRILFVLTSANKTLTGANTGWYLPEAAHPYYDLSKKYEIDFAAPLGPNPPVDESSVKNFADDQPFLDDPVVKEKLANAKKLADVTANDYDAIFYVGGHGPVLDLADNPVNDKLAGQFWAQGKIVSAVCHGPAALVGVKDAEGKSIFAGRRATAFTNEEEDQAGKAADIPFTPETRITQEGATFLKADAPWKSFVVVDGKLITGQNPASGHAIAKAIDEALSAKA